MGRLPGRGSSARAASRAPAPTTVEPGHGRVGVRDADDFIAWQEPRWRRVRVLRYRHLRADGQLFDAYGLAHIPHHHPTSVVIDALLTFLAMCLERLYRLRYLRRGTRRPHSAARVHLLLWLNLGRCEPYDTG